MEPLVACIAAHSRSSPADRFFLHMLHGNVGGPGLVATSQALLTSIADRYRYTSFDLCGSTIGLRERQVM